MEAARSTPERSRIMEMDAYPDNIGVSSLLTFHDAAVAG